MKFTRIFALIAGTSLLLTACDRDSDEAVVTIQENTNPLLAYVPADTAYVFAALEPSPKEITDAYIARFQPVLDIISKEILQFHTDYDSGDYKENTIAALATAVLDELGGNLSTESLGNLGLSMQAHHVFYAKGIFPVIRIGLRDAQELRNAIARIEAKMAYQMPVHDLNGTSYWRVANEDIPIGLYIAIVDQQLVISAFPVSAQDRLLPALLGQEMPEQSMASTNALAIMNSKKGYSSYGSGILDLQKLADEMFNPDSATHAYFGADMKFDPASLDAVCIAEMKSMIAKAPRMTGGTTLLTVNEIGMRYELEIENSLAGSLAALVSDTPKAADGNHLFSGSLAVQIGKLRSFVLEKVTALVASPYQCEMLEELNQNAMELVTQLNVPMPPMVNNLMGARVRLDDFDPEGEITQAEGLLAIYVDKPEMFVGMASMLVPGFDNLDLPNQSEPVRIPAEMMHMEDIDVFAIMSDNAIGAAIGENHADELLEFMDTESQNNGTFFSFSYDMAKQLELQSALSGEQGGEADGNTSVTDEFSAVIKQTYAAMLDRSRVDMRLTGDGLIIESTISFK